MVRTILDPYERKARYIPAMLVVLPLALLVAVVATITGVPAFAALSAVAVQFGVPVAMSNYTRSAGKAIEAGLWASWGGPPTTARLRNRDSENVHELGAVRLKLQELVPEVILPNKEDEFRDPEEADQRLEAAVRTAIQRLRDDPAGRLLFEENCSYGYWRNSLALRPFAMALTVAGGAASAVVALADGTGGRSFLVASVGIVLDGVMLLFWRTVRPETVERAARAYADAFTGAILGWRAPPSRVA